MQTFNNNGPKHKAMLVKVAKQVFNRIAPVDFHMLPNFEYFDWMFRMS